MTRYDTNCCPCCEGCDGEVTHQSGVGMYVTFDDYERLAKAHAATEAALATAREQLGAVREALEAAHARTERAETQVTALLADPRLQLNAKDVVRVCELAVRSGPQDSLKPEQRQLNGDEYVQLWKGAASIVVALTATANKEPAT